MKNYLLHTAITFIVLFCGLFEFTNAGAQEMASSNWNEGGMMRLFQNVEVAPNPFQDKFVLSYDLALDTEVNIEVYDALGRLITTLSGGTVLQQAGSQQYTLFRKPDMLSGIYFLRLTIPGQGSLTKKVIAH